MSLTAAQTVHRSWRKITFDAGGVLGPTAKTGYGTSYSQKNLRPPSAGWDVPYGMDQNRLPTSVALWGINVDNPGAEIIPFAPSTDPLGLLAELQTDELFHTADNRVSYFKMSKDPLTSKPIYDESYAGMFRLGDIVEMQMVFVAFWAGDKIQAYSHLQSLTLLDNTFTKRAETARAAVVKVVSKPTIVCRKLDYSFEDEQVEDARKRLKGLRVGEDVVMTEKNQ
ncbi:hypothetical protein C8R46DRAFT_1221248 [Mycena filopes]|nr:hypothetical protein C8R46DRAFT_1221248 [Mycena filopes]